MNCIGHQEFHDELTPGASMEPNTTAQRMGAVSTSVSSNYSILASVKSQPVTLETEYGCVDWYSYASADDARTEWFDFDSGLATGTA